MAVGGGGVVFSVLMDLGMGLVLRLVVAMLLPLHGMGGWLVRRVLLRLLRGVGLVLLVRRSLSYR